MTDYELEKWIWTETDFGQLGWHDATIYGLRLTENLELDIDYILQWNQPDIEGFQFTFWVAPATLVFERPTDLTFELTQSFNDKWLEIDDIEMEIVDSKNIWTIITQQGEISFKADTFKQVFDESYFTISLWNSDTTKWYLVNDSQIISAIEIEVNLEKIGLDKSVTTDGQTEFGRYINRYHYPELFGLA